MPLGKVCPQTEGVVEHNVSFSDDTILDGVVPLEGFLDNQTEETVPRIAQPAFPDVPTKEEPVEEAVPT